MSELPAGYTPDFITFLFQQPAHLKLQAENWQNYYLIGKTNKRIRAQIALHAEGNSAISPVKAPFGSFAYSNDLSPEALFDFIDECESRLKRRGVESIRIVEPPLYYRHHGDMLHTLLFNRGYQAATTELSCGIRVDALNFEEKLASWEKRKLRQGRARGLRFKVLGSADLEMVYNFILKCREQKGHTLSMSLDALKNTVGAFRDKFFFFGTMLEKEHVAASIAIQVHPNILYNFYSGHLKKYDPISPVVFLTSGMYKFCETKQIHLLDLGTSATDGRPNFSLLDFKMRLGGVPSIKFTFEKRLV